MVDFCADRHRGRWVPPLSALGITVAQGGAFTLLALAAIHHQISIGRLTTFAGAGIGVASMRNFSMDNLNHRLRQRGGASGGSAGGRPRPWR